MLLKVSSCSILFWAVAVSHAAEPSRPRHLLLDTRVVDRVTNAQLVLATVRKHPRNPLFGEDRPWEPRYDNMYPNVLYDEQEKIYKCWYTPFITSELDEKTPREKRKEIKWKVSEQKSGLCYATSKDGLQWDKPELGMVDFRGSKKNNILLHEIRGPGIVKDQNDPDSTRRYKMFGTNGGIGTHQIWFSPDGVRWSEPTVIKIGGHSDTRNNFYWDDNRNEWVAISRIWTKERNIARTASPDFATWEPLRMVMKPRSHNDELHDMIAFPYSGVYLGLLGINDVPGERQWVELAWSPDSIQWQRVLPGTRLIPNGAKEGDYDWGGIFATPPLIGGDEVRIYYAACNGKIDDWRDGFLCLGTIGPDRWAGYRTDGDRPGVIVTNPVVCSGKELAITADASGGLIRVTVFQEDGGEVIRSEPITGDVTDRVLADLTPFVGKRVRLSFELKQATLYSFSFPGAAHEPDGLDQVQAFALPGDEAPSGLIPVGGRKQLMADDYIIDEMKNVTRTLGSVKKHGIVLEPTPGVDDGVFFGAYLTVLRHEPTGKFQMWYSGGNPRRPNGEPSYRGTFYAESQDGIAWTKPAVSEDGRTNFVLPGTGESVMIDPTVPWGAPDKYKAAYMHKDAAGELNAVSLARSPDGIRWTAYNDGKPVTHRAADTHNQIVWDPLRKKYRVSTRTDLAGGGGPTEFRSVRIMYHEDNDLLHRPRAWETLKDKIVVGGPNVRYYPGSTSELLQFHHITCWIHNGVYFGLMNVWNHPRQELCAENDFQTRHEEDVSEYFIGTSRDGLEFDKSWVYAAKPFVPRGEAGTWDKDCIWPSSTILTWNDEHWIYYCGMNERIWNFTDATPERTSVVGLATLRRDGFIGLEASEEPGTVVTRPFVLAGKRLEVNADASNGSLRVEVLDETGKPVSGFGESECRPLSGSDSLRYRPTWGTRSDLAALEGKVIRLRFHLQNARLYAFQVVR
ncbi:MAG: hypothetical protein FJ295_11005 [Planctomycetes bacterium]|nr:hypothetical protein [Planctomycetota bacterium]